MRSLETSLRARWKAGAATSPSELKFLRTRLGRIIEGNRALEDRFGPLLDLALRVRHQENRLLNNGRRAIKPAQGNQIRKILTDSRLRGSRNKLSEPVICALLRDFSRHGEKAIAKVRRDQPDVIARAALRPPTQ